MTVQALIDALLKVNDKSLDVSVATENENLWVHDVSVHDTGTSGYEEFGTVILEVSE